MSKKVILVWFRNDLRIHDNEILYNAVQKADFIVPVYIFDTRYYEVNQRGFLNTGQLRREYTLRTVMSLKEKIQHLGGDLLTYEGLPEEIIPHLVQKYDVDEVYHHREVAKRETDISERVEEALWKIKINLKHFIGHTLYHKEDLPFPIRDIPEDFNTFRKKIEKESSVRKALPDIAQIHIPPHLEKTILPTHGKTKFPYDYGEKAALAELESVLQTEAGHQDLYVRLSPYLAIGSLSPILTYHFLSERISSQNKKNINHILDGLLRRDYFRFMLKKFSNRFFMNTETSISDPDLLQKWALGQTENEGINKLMRTLNETGNLSYKDREILGLHFIYEYKQNWLDGAAWFEQQLVDYAPATNYGFWAHLAGQGTSIKHNKSDKDWEKIRLTFY
ncbi:deoxyribodipyrimidine photolyase [Parapedobacter sp. SGR-10]|uniref:deoxyribodipyrimidine photo-lyase n=1 Tax=Parapedobacter sp. SGR-10 TaxID=2710879 RepID=UPI0013D3EB3B|nr:deoxyribodipyrimidine photo-lyase [Parapedobacter sp. SGR-10]NGF56347.1 deoxyribodipyrimidine photolyase [Parapedobacter sp. SGR-10]